MAHPILRSGMAAFVYLVLAAGSGLGFQPPKDVEYVSPDRALKAIVHTDSHGESSVRVEDTRNGALLLMRDDTSSDGSHGHAVVHAAWTPDSQFFVAGLESSAAHPPWSHPIWVYSRASNHVVELSTLGLTVVANFQLRPPDILRTRVLGPGANGRKAGESLAVSLHTLLATGHAPSR